MQGTLELVGQRIEDDHPKILRSVGIPPGFSEECLLNLLLEKIRELRMQYDEPLYGIEVEPGLLDRNSRPTMVKIAFGFEPASVRPFFFKIIYSESGACEMLPFKN